MTIIQFLKHARYVLYEDLARLHCKEFGLSELQTSLRTQMVQILQ